MTTIITPNPEQWAVLQELELTATGGNVVIISPEMQAQLEKKYRPADLDELSDSASCSYDCGGEADTWLDVVTSTGHSYFSFLEDEAESLDIKPNDTETPEEPHVSLQQSQDQAE